MLNLLKNIYRPILNSADSSNTTAFFIFRLIVLPALAGMLTWTCIENNFVLIIRAVDTIFFGGIFFSFAITINTANMRRFQAIDELAKLWGLATSFWHTMKLEMKTDAEKEQLRSDLSDFFETLRLLLHIDTIGEDRKQQLHKLDSFFEKLGRKVYQLRTEGLNSPETACLWQWIKEMSQSNEKLLSIKDNRTPKSLRLFIDWSLVGGVLLLTPQFANYGNLGIMIAVLVMIVLLSLIKVQKMLEHPFGKDMDDVDLRCRDKNKLRFTDFSSETK